MIAHLIGGPAHGRDELVSEFAPPTFKFPELPDMPLSVRDYGAYGGELGMIVHEYRLIHQDGRYATYRWRPPRVTAHFAFTVHGPDYDGRLYDKLHDLTEEGAAVKVIRFFSNGRGCDVGGIVTVDGPPDAQAAADASVAVKAVIEQKLRGYQISAFTVDVAHD